MWGVKAPRFFHRKVVKSMLKENSNNTKISLDLLKCIYQEKLIKAKESNDFKTIQHFEEMLIDIDLENIKKEECLINE